MCRQTLLYVIPRPVRKLAVGIRSPVKCQVSCGFRGIRIATPACGLVRNDGELGLRGGGFLGGGLLGLGQGQDEGQGLVAELLGLVEALIGQGRVVRALGILHEHEVPIELRRAPRGGEEKCVLLFPRAMVR